MFLAFLYGVSLSFSLIMPLGIQNIFIINQGANQVHFLKALPSVVTASFCDVCLILLAVSGVSLIMFQFAWLKLLFLLVGFLFLLYMSVVTWLSQPRHDRLGDKPLSARQQIMFSASVSLLNPHALLDSVGVIGVNSLQYSGYTKLAYTCGCIVVSCLWFPMLSVVGHFFCRLDHTGSKLGLLNKVSAVVIFLVAIFIAWQFVTLLNLEW